MNRKRPRPLSYRETVRFHGHDGPFLALGYRLGKFLTGLLKPRSIMDLKITVKTRMKKPYTCILDGLQCATFATLGKGNLVPENVDGSDIFVHVRKGRQVLKFRMSRLSWEICAQADDLEKAARRVLRTAVEELWHACD
jgi:formylmethanofuran dehydrogenase subunit E